MNEANKAIVKSINSGQYFIDARIWYLDKFIGIHVEKTFLFIIAGLLTFTASIALLYSGSISSNVHQLAFLTYNNDIDNKYSYIKPLSTTISPQLAIEEQLIKSYVETRESFKQDNEKEISSYIKNRSSLEEYNKFLNNISIDNENNPILTYGKKFTYSTKVTSVVSIIHKNNGEKTATVNFDQTFDSKNKTHTLKGQANISYNVSDIEQLLGNDNKIIDFKVTKYLAKIIN